MSARAAILKLVRPENGGPRPRRILEAVASLRGKHGEKFVDWMIERGELIRYGKTKGAKYGLPQVRM